MAGYNFVCSLCCFSSISLPSYESHYVRRHRFDPSFSVTCGIQSCGFSTKRWNTYKVHVHRKHANLPDDQDGSTDSDNDMDIDIDNPNYQDNQTIHDNLKFQNGLFTMGLEAKYNIPQTAINNIVTSTDILFDSHVSHIKQVIKGQLEERHIDTSFIDDINVSHLMDDFDTSRKRYDWYEHCDDLPYVRPEEVVLGTKHVTKNGTLHEKQLVGYYVPFLKSINRLLDMPEVWEQVQKPRESDNGFMYDICDGEYISSNALFQQHPNALQIVLNTDDLEIVNPLGSHVKKHKLTVFYYTIANIAPQYRSRLSSIQLVAIAKTNDVRQQGGETKLLSDFISSVNELSDNGVNMDINMRPKLIYGALVMLPADTLASNWLGGYKEGVAFAQKNCRMCDISNVDIKQAYLENEYILRNENTHKERCNFLSELSRGSRRYWSKLWGINNKSCLMNLSNFSITSGLVQDPMHVYLEGIIPRDLSALLYHFVQVKKYFTLKWLNFSVRVFAYSKGHANRKPEDTFDKIDAEIRIKQSSSSLYTLCQVLPLIIGMKIPVGDEHWINFLRLIQILLLCTSTYCNKQTATILRILIAIYLRTGKVLYPKASFIPKKHYATHFPRQMLMYGPLRHHWCMRFEGKHSFFKSKKLKNFKNLPFSLSRHHQLYMCSRQVGIKGEMSENFLYEGDVVAEGNEINFISEYPQLAGEMANLSKTEAHDEWKMYQTKSTTIHGLLYWVGCALVMDYDDDTPVFGLLEDIIVYRNDKYFILKSCDHPAPFECHTLHYTLNPRDIYVLKSFHGLKFKWPLSVYTFNEELVTMNVNSHTCEIF